eukprot:CAMPEP_0172501158 /NCGR_PEP_ID=MMETSP1066-20121228/146734_1 /TAXON_ID=671091 /ORGANISM="Coscinodiscus wailesii, Strain CCMP2513" /LENGTH=402 /DNA_ID=CAMNT_0013275789 /DNA_START=102 /DNA_END=1310 /DNA_ORIENTATION=-
MSELNKKATPDHCRSGYNASCDNTSSQAKYPFDAILEQAKSRYLKVTELEYLLDPEMTPLPILSKPPHCRPASGTLLLFDRNVTVNYKEDGYHWIKKRNSLKVREDHVKLRVKGVYKVAGIYCHSSNPVSLHRRAYHLLDPVTGITKVPVVKRTGGEDRERNVNTTPSLVLVHYLDTVKAAEYACASAAGTKKRKAYFGKKRQSTAVAAPSTKATKKSKTQHSVPCNKKIFYPSQLSCLDWSSLTDLCRDCTKSYKPAKPVVVSSTPSFRESELYQSNVAATPIVRSSESCIRQGRQVVESSLLEKAALHKRPEDVLSLAFPDNISSFNITPSLEITPQEQKAVEKDTQCGDQVFDALWDFIVESDANVEDCIRNNSACDLRLNNGMNITPTFIDGLCTLFD